MNLKQNLRKQLLTYRLSLSREQLEVASAQVCSKLIQSKEYDRANQILFYMATKNEINLSAAIERAWSDRKKVLLPRVKGQTIECIPFEPNDELQTGSFGILEPINEPNVNPREIDLVLVPGIAFDVKGYRIGYGGGYYDRFFSQYNQLQRVGILEHGQLVPTVYPEPHDQPLHLLITSKQIIKSKKGENA